MLYSQSQPSIPPVSRRRPSRMGMRSCWTGWKARPASSPCSSGWQTAWRQWVSLGGNGGCDGILGFAYAHPDAAAAIALLCVFTLPPAPLLALMSLACSRGGARRGFQGGGGGSRQRAAGSPQAAGSPVQRLCNPLPGGQRSTAQHSAAWQGRSLQPASGLVGMGQQCLVFPLPADLSQTATHILACATYRLPCRTGRYAWRWFTSPTLVIATTSASCGT